MRACVLSQNGLGDGFISLVLSNNLRNMGWDVVTLHGSLGLMGEWFPNLKIERYPEPEVAREFLDSFDRLYVFYTRDYAFVNQIIDIGKSECPEKVKIIYPEPFIDPRSCPHYRDFPIEGQISFVENIRRQMGGVKDNGLRNPGGLVLRKEKKRVVLHVRSSKDQKDWPIRKFIQLGRRLKARGFDPIFIVGESKYRGPYRAVEKEFAMPDFKSLDEIARFVFESGFLIGIDSGLGHMASSMGLPTITLARRESTIRFWRPDRDPNTILTPPKWVPNLKGLRLRDRFWKKFVSVDAVMDAFLVNVE